MFHNIGPETVFTTLHFVRNLRMDAVTRVLRYTRMKKALPG
jgi:hypothetical protein